MSTTIFTESTSNPTTISTANPPEGSTLEFDKEENRSSGITINTSNVESNVNIGVSTRNIYSSVPNSNVDEDVIFRDDPKPIDDFVLPSFTVKVESQT